MSFYFSVTYEGHMFDKRIHYQLTKSCGELHLYKVTLN